MSKNSISIILLSMGFPLESLTFQEKTEIQQKLNDENFSGIYHDKTDIHLAFEKAKEEAILHIITIKMTATDLRSDDVIHLYSDSEVLGDKMYRHYVEDSNRFNSSEDHITRNMEGKSFQNHEFTMGVSYSTKYLKFDL